MKLIVALGNPEKRYDGTRHNVGFEALDFFARQNELVFRNKSKFQADIAAEEGYLLVKPTTYYNLTGISIRALADFYKIHQKDILVVHDDLVLPFGTIRVREGGSDAGNNGLKSIESHVGKSTHRLRIGTYNEIKEKMDMTDFVLAKFDDNEKKKLPVVLKKASELIKDFTEDKLEITTHK